MKENNKYGFTLVELLAVIVILAIILVIAVPKVMSIIEDAKKGTLESTAKMIASAAEKAKVQNAVLGKDEEITCDSVAKINDVDYEACVIEFEGNTAKVTLIGSGKFSQLSVCSGTKKASNATKGSCGLISLTVDLAGGIDNVDYKESYEAGSEVVLTSPTREGYSFMGWSVNGESSSIVDGKLKLGEDATTVTAIWEEYSEDYPVLISGPAFNEGVHNFGLESVITEISIVDSYTPTGNEYGDPIDISLAEDGSILVYVIMTSETTGKAIIVGNGSGGILLNEDSSKMFFGLSNLKEIKGMDLLRWVNVKDNSWMFAGTGIESIDFGKAKTIGLGTFSGCTNLTSIIIPNSVTSIGISAFAGCSNLRNITIPNSVTSIGSNAFYDCSSLTNIIIPNSVTSIEAYAFSNCTGLTSIEIPNSVTSIENGVFYTCTNLTSISIPEGVTSIGNSAFEDCSSLTSIEIPNSVTSIGDYAFDGCTGLTSITIPNSVTYIGGHAFQNCTKLTSITIPNSVTVINSYAFYDCSSLTSITIPNSVTYIFDSAFYDCSGLTDVYYTGTSDEWSKISIGSYNEPLTNTTIHYEHVIN